MGRFITLPGVNPGTDRPFVNVLDPLESAGSLWLVEPMNPAQQWAAGVPSNNGAIPNVLANKGAALTGSTAGLTLTTAGLSGTQGKLERSGKGGLHAIYSNTNATNIGTPNTAYARIRPDQAIKDYLFANLNHEMFFSMWVYATRLAPDGKQFNVIGQISRTTSATGNFKAHIGQSVSNLTGTSGSRLSSMTNAGGRTPGPRIQNVARPTFIGTPPTNATSDMDVDAFSVGNGGTINSYLTSKQGVGSHILYRSYLEDLTVSGRSYATVDALDMAEYTKQVLTPGGRYYGDTFTDPTTIP